MDKVDVDMVEMIVGVYELYVVLCKVELEISKMNYVVGEVEL